MKRLLITAAAVPVLALVGAAQDATQKMKAELENMVTQAKVISISGGMMSTPVKGAPYSGVEVSETNHVLADGTRIHNESRTTVYRDSEGRVRRETPNQTTIMDPVAGVTYFLNPKTQTATKAHLSIPTFKRDVVLGAAAGGVGTTVSGETSTFEVHTKDGVTTMSVNGKPVDPASVKEQTAFTKMAAEQADLAALDAMRAGKAAAGAMFSTMPPPGNFTFSSVDGGFVTRKMAPGQTDALGKQMIEGVNSDGSRVTSTLETGAVGNDRPIQIVNERWYSQELQTVMMTKHSDPRTGEETFRLTNVSRGEPGADLFQVPTSYTIVDRK